MDGFRIVRKSVETFEEFEAYDRSMKNLIKGGSFEDYRKASENLKIQVSKEFENYHKTLDVLNTARKNLIKFFLRPDSL